MALMHGTYTGKIKHLKGKTAVLREGSGGSLLAQFDDVNASIMSEEEMRYTPADDWPAAYILGHGWHAFPPADFDIDLRCADTPTEEATLPVALPSVGAGLLALQGPATEPNPGIQSSVATPRRKPRPQ